MKNKENTKNKVLGTKVKLATKFKKPLLSVATRKLNGPLVIGLVLSPAVIMLVLGSVSSSQDPSGISGAINSIFFTLPAIVSVLLIVAGLSKSNVATVQRPHHSYASLAHLIVIIIISFFDIYVVYGIWLWMVDTGAYIFWLTIMVFILGISAIPIIINVRSIRRISSQ
jgi:hypothetical protein